MNQAISYIADTNLLIDYYRGVDKAKEYIQKLKSGEIKLAVSVVTETEIWIGIKDDEELLKWVNLLDEFFESVDVNSNIARKAGEIWKEFGHYMGKTSDADFRNIPDAFIAATCNILDRTLITANVKHFIQLIERGILKCERYKT